MAFAQAQAALDETLAYVQTRQQFGRPLVDFQAVQLKLADMALKVSRHLALCPGACKPSGAKSVGVCPRRAARSMQVDTARLLLDRAVAEADAAENGLPSMLSSSMAKCYANEIGVEVLGGRSD